ncbi:MAG: hypothetical protein Q4F00_05035 [bacterium]|nr:hypothetical protein [bacterium]
MSFAEPKNDDLLGFDFGVDFGISSAEKAGDSRAFSAGTTDIKSSLDFSGLDSSLSISENVLEDIGIIEDQTLAADIRERESSMHSAFAASDNLLDSISSASDAKFDETVAASGAGPGEMSLAEQLAAAGTTLAASGKNLQTEANRAMSSDSVRTAVSGANEVKQGVEAVKQGIEKIRQIKSADGTSLKAKAAAVTAGVTATVAGVKQIAKGVKQGEEGARQIKHDFTPAARGVKRVVDQVKEQSGPLVQTMQREALDYARETYQILDPSKAWYDSGENKNADTGASSAVSRAGSGTNKPDTLAISVKDVQDAISLMKNIIMFASNKQEDLSNIGDEYRALLAMNTKNAKVPQQLVNEITKQVSDIEIMLAELTKTRQTMSNTLAQFSSQTNGKGVSIGEKRTMQEWLSLTRQFSDTYSEQQRKVAALLNWYNSHRTHIRSILPVGGAASLTAAMFDSQTAFNDLDSDEEQGTISINGSCLALFFLLAMLFFFLVFLL